MTPIILLSKNDIDALSTALRRLQSLTLTRALGALEITVSVRPAPAVWPVAMLVQVRKKEKGVEWVQNFESLEKAREAIG